MKTILIAVLGLLYSIPGFCFRPFILHSGKAQIQFVELYSSEGCTKCLPAEKWVTSLRSNKGLFKKFIAVVFHTDLLNAEGWTDPFSKPEFSTRYKDIDMPAFFSNGESWTWDENSKLPSGDAEAAGDLNVARVKLQEFEVTFNPSKSLTSPQVSASLLGSGIQKTVAGGQNDGQTVNHDFTVLEFATKSLKKSGGAWTTHIKLPMAKNTDVKIFSAVFWITEEGQSEVIQSTGGDLKLE